MPYDGGSVTGLIILLFEVPDRSGPHKNDAAYDLFCSSFPLKLNTNVISCQDIFLFFALTPRWGGKKKNIDWLSKS